MITIEANKDNPELDPYLIEVLSTPTKYRSIKAINRIVQAIKNLQPLIAYFHCSNPSKENDLIIDIATVLRYEKYRQNSIVKKACEKDANFFVILKGKVAELAFKYEKLFVTEDEYFIHLIKLSLLQERELLNECIKMNKHIFPINEEIIAWIKSNKEDQANEFINKAHGEIFKTKSLYNQRNIKYYINITNPFSANAYSRINSKTQYSITLPSYCHIQTVEPGNYIGTLSLNKRYRIYSTFVAIEDTEIGVFEKSYISRPRLYKIIDDQIKEDLIDIMKSYFIFQSLQKNYFENLICPLFTYKKVVKGDHILKQNSRYEGVYLIKNGQFKITSFVKSDEISGIIVELKQSLDNYKNYMSNLKENINEDFPQQNLEMNLIYKSSEYLTHSKLRREITLSTINSKQVIGFNEFYNNKTDIIRFNVKCTSETAEVYFLPKESFYSIMDRDRSSKLRVAKLIEQNVRFYIQTIRKYKEQVLKDLQLTIAKNTKREEAYLANLSKIYKNTMLSHQRKITTPMISRMNSTSSVSSNLVIKKYKLKKSFSQVLLSGNSSKVEEARKLFNDSVNEKCFNPNSTDNTTLYPTLLSGLTTRKNLKGRTFFKIRPRTRTKNKVDK